MPTIGITPTYDNVKRTSFVRNSYIQPLLRLEAVPLMPPVTDDTRVLDAFLSKIDGLLVTGGDDINPCLFGQTVHPASGYFYTPLDKMELYCIRRAAGQQKPVLGICRGMQLMNVAFGGTIYQDLASQRPGSICHRQPAEVFELGHTVTLSPGSRLQGLLGQSEVGVNSFHHQACHVVGEGLCPTAAAPDGVIEAIEGREGFFVGVQWHPELLPEDNAGAAALFAAFMKSTNR